MIFSPLAVARNREKIAFPSIRAQEFFQEIYYRVQERVTDLGKSFPSVLSLGSLGGAPYGPKNSFHILTDPSLTLLKNFSYPNAFSVCHSLDLLPFKKESFDFICSGFVLHFSNDFPQTLYQIYECLKPGGGFLGVFLGGESLKEARHALTQAEISFSAGGSPRFWPLMPLEDSAFLFHQVGFQEAVIDRDILKFSVPSFKDLMKTIKELGLRNSLDFSWRRPGSRHLFEKADEFYKSFYTDSEGELKVTLELIFMIGWKNQ